MSLLFIINVDSKVSSNFCLRYIIGDRMPRPNRKAAQCGGNACPRCNKCIDWSYNGNLHDDYKRYQRDSTCDRITHKDNWFRDPSGTCTYYMGGSHVYCRYDSYHCHYAFKSYLCECDKSMK